MAAKLTIPKSQQLRFMNMAYKNPSHTMYKLPRYDTRLFNDFYFQNKFEVGYCQKIQQDDTLLVQFLTTYPDFVLTLRNKITFAETAYNGVESLIYSYTDADGDTINVYNVPITVSSLNGYYDFIIRGYAYELPDIFFVSEPFEVREEHEGTVLCKFGGNESINDGMRWGEASYLIDYPQYLRFKGQVIDIKFGGDLNKYIDSDSESTNLNSYPKATHGLDFKEMPYYMVEKLSLALQHDYFDVDGLQLNIEEELDVTNMKNEIMSFGTVQLRQVSYENYTELEVLTGDAPTFPQSYMLINDTDYMLINATDKMEINN